MSIEFILLSIWVITVGTMAILYAKRGRHSDLYKKYLKSEEWDYVRIRELRRAGFKCEKCGMSNVTLQAHHLNYRNLGHELPGDIQILCIPCHKKADKIRKNNNKKYTTWVPGF